MSQFIEKIMIFHVLAYAENIFLYEEVTNQYE